MKTALRVAKLTRQVPGVTNLLRYVLPLSLKRRFGAALMPAQCNGQTVKSNDGREFLVIPDRLFLRVLYDGNYEPGQTAFMASIVEADDVCVDVGANFGWYTTLMGSKAKKTFAFEPLARSFEFLSRNVELNSLNGRAIPKNAAVGAEPGSIRLVIDGSENESGLAHVAGPGESGSQEVELVTLDSELSENIGQISLMKMDVEGSEIEVIRGASKVLGCDNPPVIVAEANNEALVHLGSSRDELCSLIRSHGYEIDALTTDGKVIADDGEADTIVCIPDRGRFSNRVTR